MRRKIIILLISLVVFLPINLNAVEIKGASFSAQDEVEVGSKLSFHVEPAVVGFTPGDENTLGYLIAYIEVLYDEDVLLLENVKIPHFETDFTSEEVKIEKNHRLIAAQLSDESAPDLCAYRSLYCGDLNIDIDFFARNTDATSTNVEIRNVTLVYFDINEETSKNLENMTEEELVDFIVTNMQTTSADVKISKTVNIKKNNSAPVQEPTVIENDNSSVLKPIIPPKVEQAPNIPSTTTNTSSNKSSNSNLSSLEIYNYNIDFNKDTKNYEISISKEVNKLDVRASVEDSKAIYKIIGSDDLKSNNYTVTIEVIAEDNTKSTYTIKANLKDEKINENVVNDKKEQKKINVKLDKKVIMLIGGITGGVVLIVILIVINTIRKKKAINKMFKEL